MEFKEILNKRHSSRSFTEKKIDKKDLKEIALILFSLGLIRLIYKWLGKYYENCNNRSWFFWL